MERISDFASSLGSETSEEFLIGHGVGIVDLESFEPHVDVDPCLLRRRPFISGLKTVGVSDSIIGVLVVADLWSNSIA